MQAKRTNEDKNERLLILVVDIDNDLYVKTKINGPLLGRVQNLNGATQLHLQIQKTQMQTQCSKQ
jgi:Predicted membrane protein